MFSWFDAKDAEKFGTSLADFFIERIPSESLQKKSVSLAKQKDVLNKLVYKVQLYGTEHKLNIYKKAKLGNAFKWKMREAHYDPAFIDEVTKMLMVKM
ncbi:hypothetical protein [Herbaspirillum sp. ST 5-3]|uniref:hypothetical protein n=1 Tax=Oxalobacteraceae TaxID=75682 RepID=UPI0010A4B8B1|nr:hypothetical protein [Herbaspirillum sp. ST 5-3]